MKLKETGVQVRAEVEVSVYGTWTHDETESIGSDPRTTRERYGPSEVRTAKLTLSEHAEGSDWVEEIMERFKVLVVDAVTRVDVSA